MSERRAVRPADGAAPIGPYSPGLVVDGWVFVSGQGPLDPATGTVVGETIEEQTERTLANVAAVLGAAGASPADVVSATVHLADTADFERFNGVYARFFGEPKPTRTTVQSVLLGGILVEIAVIARLP